MARRNKLTAKQRIFVDAFLGEAKGNATQAAKLAGVPGRSAAQQGYKWLRKAHVQHAIHARIDRREEATEFDALENDRFMLRMRDNERVEDKTRLSAGKELNKCNGRHSLNVKHDVTERLANLLGRTWAQTS